MKTNLIHTTLLTLLLPAAALLFAGCDLTLLPQDSMSPNNYFKTATELELWTNSFYTMFDTPESAIGSNDDTEIDKNIPDYIAGTRSAATESGWTWTQLRKINYYFAHSSNCPDEAVRRQYDGVAHFFRAYFYFVKVRRYGDVPWYDTVLESDDEASLKRPRDDRGWVMDRVIEDFDAAADMLPGRHDVSRVTRWTALAFKSRAALYEGTFRKYHGLGDAEKYLQIAADAAAEFLAQSGYTLYEQGDEPYRELFYSDDAKAEEVVIARLYNKADLNLGHDIQHTISGDSHSFTRRFMNHYQTADGKRITEREGYATASYLEETAKRDPRMAQTVLCPGYKQVGASRTTVNNLSSFTGYTPIKYVSTAAHDGGDQCTADFPLMRSAEVMLNYAEALAELGTLTQADLDISVNLIRKRAKMPALKMADANADPDPMLEAYYPNVTRSANTGVILEIRRERTVELAFEGYRVWDMFRWKEGLQLVNSPNPYYGCYFPGPGAYDMDGDGVADVELYKSAPTSNAPTKKMLGTDVVLSEGDSGYMVAFGSVVCTWNEQRDYLWPIPADQRVLTGGRLTQNPGWTDGLDL